MFFSNIGIAKKYNYLEEKFLAAYKWLEETDMAALPVGSYPIMGDTVVANIQEYTTIKPEEGSFETHEKFLISSMWYPEGSSSVSVNGTDWP